MLGGKCRVSFECSVIHKPNFSRYAVLLIFVCNPLATLSLVRHHGVGSEINSRKRVEHIMSKRNILIKDAEELDDIGLLFGGIEDQSLHHDTARQLTSWMVRWLDNHPSIVIDFLCFDLFSYPFASFAIVYRNIVLSLIKTKWWSSRRFQAGRWIGSSITPQWLLRQLLVAC